MPTPRDPASPSEPAPAPAARRAWWTLARVQIPVLLAAAAVLGLLGMGGPAAAGVLVLRLERSPDGRWISPTQPGRKGVTAEMQRGGAAAGAVDASVGVSWTAGPGWASLRIGRPAIVTETVYEGFVGGPATLTDPAVLAEWADRLEVGDADATAGTRIARPTADVTFLLRALADAERTAMDPNRYPFTATRGAAVRIALQAAAALCFLAAFALALTAMVRTFGHDRAPAWTKPPVTPPAP